MNADATDRSRRARDAGLEDRKPARAAHEPIGATVVPSPQRRAFLRGAASVTAFALTGCAAMAMHGRTEAATRPDDDAQAEAEVTPGEDLMQEHAVLERVLLVYDEAVRRIEYDEPFDPTLLTRAAGIVRRFVEDYHEQLEEKFVFPRLRAAGREVELVSILLRQHERGREVTDHIARLAAGATGPELAQALRSFSRMYRPHAAREATVLFPAFRQLLGRSGYAELGEQFEDEEHELFGEDGFQQVVGQVADLERALGIHDLAQFTPAAERAT